MEWLWPFDPLTPPWYWASMAWLAACLGPLLIHWQAGSLRVAEDVAHVRLERALREAGFSIKLVWGLSLVRSGAWKSYFLAARPSRKALVISARSAPTPRMAVAWLATMPLVLFGVLGLVPFAFSLVLALDARAFVRRRLQPLVQAAGAPVPSPSCVASLAEARRLARSAQLASAGAGSNRVFTASYGAWYVLFAIIMTTHGSVPLFSLGLLLPLLMLWAAWPRSLWVEQRRDAEAWVGRLGTALEAELDSSGARQPGPAPVEVLLAAEVPLGGWLALDSSVQEVRKFPAVPFAFGFLILLGAVSAVALTDNPDMGGPFAAPTLAALAVTVLAAAGFAVWYRADRRRRREALLARWQAWRVHLAELRSQMEHFLEGL